MCPRARRSGGCSGRCCSISSRRTTPTVREALREAGREDLIGAGPECLIPLAAAAGGSERIRG